MLVHGAENFVIQKDATMTSYGHPDNILKLNLDLEGLR